MRFFSFFSTTHLAIASEWRQLREESRGVREGDAPRGLGLFGSDGWRGLAAVVLRRLGETVGRPRARDAELLLLLMQRLFRRRRRRRR